MFQISRNILPEFRQRFATAYSPWPRTSPNQVAFVMSHVLWGCSPSVFWTYVTYVSNVILTRASIDLMCRTFVSVQQAKKWCLHQIYIYIQLLYSIVYIYSIFIHRTNHPNLWFEKDLTSVGARGLCLKSVSVRVNLGILPHFQTLC